MTFAYVYNKWLTIMNLSNLIVSFGNFIVIDIFELYIAN
jgi:hypothetical protein